MGSAEALPMFGEELFVVTMLSLEEEPALERPADCGRFDDEEVALKVLVMDEKKPEPNPKLDPRLLESGLDGDPDSLLNDPF
jgi:hypothetical protein